MRSNKHINTALISLSIIILFSALIVFAATGAESDYPINFTFPTTLNATVNQNISIEINITMNASNLTSFIFNWNGTNHTIFNDSLKLYLNFDNISALGEDYKINDTVEDISGHGNDARIGNFTGQLPILVPGRYGNAMYFNSTNFNTEGDCLRINHSDTLNPGSNDFAIIFWTKYTQMLDSDIMRKGSTATHDQFGYAGGWYKVEMSAVGSNAISFNFRSSAASSVTSQTANDVYNDDEWHHVVAQKRGSNIELWVDGTIDDIDAVTGLVSNAANLTIGCKDTQDDDFTNATIDEMQIWINRSFNHEQINQLYMSNLRLEDIDEFQFYSNQTNSSSTDLTVSNYTSIGYAEYNFTKWNQTERRTFSIIPEDYVIQLVPLNNSNVTAINNTVFNCSAFNYDGELKNVSLWFSTEGTQTGLGFTEDYETGWANGAAIGTHADWTGANPTVDSGVGVNGGVGLAAGSAIFIWSGHEFNWSNTSIKKMGFCMDFESEATADFNDDRVGWQISDTMVGSSLIFGAQLEPATATNVARIEGYWDGPVPGDDEGRPFIAALPTIIANNWYKLCLNITPIGNRMHNATQWNVSFYNLTPSGEIDELLVSATIFNTSDSAETGNLSPNNAYFNQSLFPAFKNFASGASYVENADNAHFFIETDTVQESDSTTWHLNDTEPVSGTSDIATFYKNLTDDSTYIWSCSMNDTNDVETFAINNWTFKTNVSLGRDITPPQVALISPEDNAQSNLTVNFTFTATDNMGLKNATLYLCNITNVTVVEGGGEATNHTTRYYPTEVIARDVLDPNTLYGDNLGTVNLNVLRTFNNVCTSGSDAECFRFGFPDTVPVTVGVNQTYTFNLSNSSTHKLHNFSLKAAYCFDGSTIMGTIDCNAIGSASSDTIEASTPRTNLIYIYNATADNWVQFGTNNGQVQTADKGNVIRVDNDTMKLSNYDLSDFINSSGQLRIAYEFLWSPDVAQYDADMGVDLMELTVIHESSGNEQSEIVQCNETWKANETIDLTGISQHTNITVELLDNRSYWWNVLVCDSAHQCSFNETNRTLKTNSSYVPINLPPTVTLLTPENNTNHNTTTNFTFSTTDSNLKNATLYLCNITNATLIEAGGGGDGNVLLVQSAEFASSYADTTNRGNKVDISAPTINNVLIAAIAIDKNAGTIITPPGFTLVHSEAGTTSSGGLAYKVATGEENNVTWNWTNGEEGAGWVGEFSGLDTSGLADTSDENITFESTGTNVMNISADSVMVDVPQFSIAIVAADSANTVEFGRTYSNDYQNISSFWWQGGALSGQPFLAVANKTHTVAETASMTFTHTDDPDQMVGFIATFKIDEGGDTQSEVIQCNETFRKNESIDISGSLSNTNITVKLQERKYWWNVEVCDTDHACTFADNNWTINITSTIETPPVFVEPIPIWGAIHAIHTSFSDGQMEVNESATSIEQYFDWGATNDHDTSLTQAEWDATINTSNTWNDDGNFTYFFGLEWTDGSGHVYYYINGNPPVTQIDAGDAGSQDIPEFTLWLKNNNGLGNYNHPARDSGGRDLTVAAQTNETYIPTASMINRQSLTTYFHWNFYWNCTGDSGCTTYENPFYGASLENEGSGKWIKWGLDAGQHIGFACGGDDHSDLPYTPGCYLGVLGAKNYSRQAVFDAMNARHTFVGLNKTYMNVSARNKTHSFILGDIFNTTTDTIIINYSINASPGHTIDNISVFYNGVIINVTKHSGEKISGSYNLTLTQGEEDYVFIEVRDSMHSYSWGSPMWITYNPSEGVVEELDKCNYTINKNFNITIWCNFTNTRIMLGTGNLTIHPGGRLDLIDSNFSAGMIFVNVTVLEVPVINITYTKPYDSWLNITIETV